jgi:hypothetical protein
MTAPHLRHAEALYVRNRALMLPPHLRRAFVTQVLAGLSTGGKNPPVLTRDALVTVVEETAAELEEHHAHQPR